MTEDSECLLTLKEAAYALVITPERLKILAARGFARPAGALRPPKDQRYTRAEVERLRQNLALLKELRER